MSRRLVAIGLTLPADQTDGHRWRDRDAMATDLADALSPKLPTCPWGRAVQWLGAVMKQAGDAKALANRDVATKAHAVACTALFDAHKQRFSQ